VDVVTVMAEIRHLLVMVRQANLAYDELDTPVKLAIEASGSDPDQLRRLVPMLTTFSTDVRQHLEGVFVEALTQLAAGPQPLRVVGEARSAPQIAG